VGYYIYNKGENKMEKIDMSTSLLDKVSIVEENLIDYNNNLSNILNQIIPVIKLLVKERNDRLALTESTSDYVTASNKVSMGDILKLQEQIDELKNTDSGMAVAKLQDSIDEHEERIDELDNDIQSILVRLDDAEVSITI
tara:strand:- start:394 stop:813 length:420 start_codon:yes stop_codon:yes gene_type:complete